MAKKENDNEYDPDGSPGKPGEGFGKGDPRPDKYKERTQAQRDRNEKQADRMG